MLKGPRHSIVWRLSPLDNEPGHPNHLSGRFVVKSFSSWSPVSMLLERCVEGFFCTLKLSKERQHFIFLIDYKIELSFFDDQFLLRVWVSEWYKNKKKVTLIRKFVIKWQRCTFYNNMIKKI